MFRTVVFAIMLVSCLAAVTSQAQQRKTENVFLITSDGLRWQEVFSGADKDLINTEAGGIKEQLVENVRKTYWADTPEVRRKILMPFFWSTVVTQGQIFGSPAKKSRAYVTNPLKFSYPGYNEMLTGKVDPSIVSNAKRNNPNVTVLEWLHHKDGFQGTIAAYSAWVIMPYILNRDRCGFPVFGGWERLPEKEPNPRQELLNDLLAETTPDTDGQAFDSLVFESAMEHIKRHKPRVMFISFLETDHWGHAGQYDKLLRAAHSYDDYVRKLWEYCQSAPQYKDKTTFILVTDHGRGVAPVTWRSHKSQIEGAENIWMAFLGPDTLPLGERSETVATQNQIAATLAAFLGEDYHAAVPASGQPIHDVLPGVPKQSP